MLIASKFHDYYDTAAVYGIDKTCVYIRNEEKLPGKFKMPTRFNHWPHDERLIKTKSGIQKASYDIDKYVIGFCGKLYPVVVIVKTADSKIERFSFYSTEKVDAFFAKEKFSVKKDAARLYWGTWDFSVRSKLGLDNFFDVTHYKKLEEEFHKNKCPVFIYGEFIHSDIKTSKKPYLILNPRLKDYRFAQVKDPQTAFQDVFMYLSGVIGMPEVPMVKISDKELAAKKGHGDKYSFRKPPGKRGKKKWR